MEKIFVVQAEHPYDSGIKLSLHRTKAGADKRAAELLNAIRPALEEVEDIIVPEATAETWKSIEAEHAPDANDVPEDGFGMWWVARQEIELED